MKLYNLLMSLIFTFTIFGADADRFTKVFLQEDCESSPYQSSEPFPTGKISDKSQILWNVTVPNSFEIVKNPVKSGRNALKVFRNGASGYISIGRKDAIPEGHDFRISFQLQVPEKGGCTIFFSDGKNSKPIGGLSIKSGRNIWAYDINQKWVTCSGLIVPPNKWLGCQIDFNSNRKNYQVSLIGEDGKKISSIQSYPFLQNTSFRDLMLLNTLPQGTTAFFDDIKILYSDNRSLEGCQNIAQGLIADSPGLAQNDASKLTNGNYDDGILLEVKKPRELEFSFTLPVKAQGIKIHSGDRNNSRQIKSFKLQSYNSLGHWYTLAEYRNPAGEKAPYIDFKPEDNLVKLRLTFPAQEDIFLREIEFFAPPDKPQHELDEFFQKCLSGEFRLPVYDGQYENHRIAELYLINTTPKDLPVKIKLVRRDAPLMVISENKHQLRPGSNRIPFDIKELSSGEYIAVVSDDSIPAKTNAGRLRRLLRISNSQSPSPVTPLHLTGQKMLFPDYYYFQSHSGLECTPMQAEKKLVHRGNTDDNCFIVYGDNIFIDDKGSICVNFHTWNRLWETASARYYHANASGTDLSSWQVLPGKANIPPDHRNPLQGKMPKPAIPDWELKKVGDQPLKYHFYDPEKDGPVNLKQLKLVWVHPAQPGTVGYQNYDWQVMRPPHSTTWPIWYKSPGEAIILRKTPLIQSIVDGSGFENPDSGSDLGFGQWLSDDGKYLHYAQGRHLYRFPPFTAPWDNIHWLSRIISVWRTADGINWERRYLGVPDTNMPVAAQHYGGLMTRIPNGGGLRLAFLNHYDALHQQMNVVLVYSWDGFNWRRFPHAAPFVNNGSPGDWLHGGCYFSLQAVEKDGKIYQLIPWANDHYHFQSEVVHSSKKSLDFITTEYMKNRFGARNIAKWPYFKKYFDSSFEKLAEKTKAATCSVGIAVYRKDGWFALNAGNTPGKFISHPILATGTMKVNIDLKQNGYFKIELIDSAGNTIQGFQKTIEAVDNTDLSVFSHLPSQEFRIKAELRNGTLYSIGFER